MWLATHSLEAAEVTGPEATFLAKRADTAERTVREIKPHSDAPLVQALASEVGSPAFSLLDKLFVFVEGDGQYRERRRYEQLYPDSAGLHFLEGGGCDEVARRVRVIRELAAEIGHPLHVKGVIGIAPNGVGEQGSNAIPARLRSSIHCAV